MPRLPARFAAVILCFAPLFVQRSWRHAEVLLIGAILAPGRRTVTSILRVSGAPSSCWREAGRTGRPRAMLEQSSGRGSNPANVGPRLERTRPCGSVLAGGDVVAAELEEVVDLVVGGEET